MSACTATYAYDARERLTKEVKRGIETTFALDVAGNLTCERRAGAPVAGYTYAGNQLETQTSDCAADVIARYWPDEEGNLDCVTTAAGSELDCLADVAPACPATASATLRSENNYDHLNRLSFCTYAGGQLGDESSYLYDALDRPIQPQLLLRRSRPRGAHGARTVRVRTCLYEP